jgi:hypothetical protein
MFKAMSASMTRRGSRSQPAVEACERSRAEAPSRRLGFGFSD